MAELNEKFKPNLKDAIANEKAVFKGKFYRITVLSESLVRLEYDEGSVFEDRPTELVKCRNFPVPEFQVQENDSILAITTKYFRLQYLKDKPFVGTMFAQDSNLKVTLNESDKVWYYGHDEARNFGAIVDNLDTKEPYMSPAEKILEEKQKKLKKFIKKDDTVKGLYSTDGFATIDDSKSLILDDKGFLIKDDRQRIDIYLCIKEILVSV